MIERIFEDCTGKRNILPPIDTPKFPETRNCFIPYCESCLMARFKKISTGPTKVNPVPEKERYLTRENYEVGHFVSTNQFICKTPG